MREQLIKQLYLMCYIHIEVNNKRVLSKHMKEAAIAHKTAVLYVENHCVCQTIKTHQNIIKPFFLTKNHAFGLSYQ